MIRKINKLITALALCTTTLLAQENLRPLNANINYFYKDLVSPKTVSSPNSQNRAASIGIPFIDDFYYAQFSKFPNQSLWSDSSTYVNTGHAIAPMSLGVATFDGLNKKGYPYTPALLDMTKSLPADTLTSKPINLQTVPITGATLQPVDSVALTFYYQARGNGDTPELSDTFMVDFYKPKQNIWASKVWHTRGNASPNTNDTIFKRGFVWINDTSYLHDGFKFRFRNRATTAGDFDHWNLDYVYLDKGRQMLVDTSYEDMTFGYIPSPILRNYSAMPWRQYTPLENVSNLNVFIRNNGKNIDNMEYLNRTDSNNVQICTYGPDSRNNLEYFPKKGWNKFPTHASPSYTACAMENLLPDTTEIRIKHIIRTGVGGRTEFINHNDTVVQTQHFKNYYAFDDGSAEAAYYVSGVGVKIAQKIKVNVTDTFRIMKIFFDPIGNMGNVATYEFTINVWADAGGFPGMLVYQNEPTFPAYIQKGVNVSAEYTLNPQFIMSPGDYYIGIQQKVANIQMGIGFDRNLDHKSSLYFDKGDGWEQSQIYGSLMMRPVIGSKTIPPVGINEHTLSQEKNFVIYPNPANTELIIAAKDHQVSSYKLTNILGQTVVEETAELSQHTVHTAHLAGGVYFLTLTSKGKAVQQQKIVVQH